MTAPPFGTVPVGSFTSATRPRDLPSSCVSFLKDLTRYSDSAAVCACISGKGNPPLTESGSLPAFFRRTMLFPAWWLDHSIWIAVLSLNLWFSFRLFHGWLYSWLPTFFHRITVPGSLPILKCEQRGLFLQKLFDLFPCILTAGAVHLPCGCIQDSTSERMKLIFILLFQPFQRPVHIILWWRWSCHATLIEPEITDRVDRNAVSNHHIEKRFLCCFLLHISLYPSFYEAKTLFSLAEYSSIW